MSPEEILKLFNEFPGEVQGPDIAVKIASVEKAYLMRVLGDIGYEPAAEAIFKYIQEVRLTTERTAGISALGKLGYTPAIDFIKREKDHMQNWLHKYKHHSRVKGVVVARQLFYAARTALMELTMLKAKSEES